MHNSPTWSNAYPETLRVTDKLIGIKIDERYLIEKELGRGGVGAVYLARDLKLHEKRVVVKVLLEKSMTDQWTVQKFLQEKEALARVDHPGVVGVLDTGELPNGEPYIVMQFVDGISLRAAIKNAPEGMDLERIASIVKQIGSALSSVHTKKIYHRDLKPENIMLQTLVPGGEQVKIVDFGIAKIKESVIAPSTVTGGATAGTIVYMSPEQLHGAKVTAASDIYSFGIIAYEMVTGRRPFNPDTIAHLSVLQREGIRVRPVDLRPRLPTEAEKVILKSLSFDQRDRYADAAEFGDALERALRSDAELAPLYQSPRHDPAAETWQGAVEVTPGQPHEVIQRSRIWPKVAAAFGLAFVLLVGGIMAALYFTSGWKNTFAGNRIDSPAPPARSLAYSLTVQKMRAGKPYQDPFQSSGQEIFESGYKFQLNVSSPESGYLYVFNEGANDKTAGTSFTIIYPTPNTNQGSARLKPGSTLATNWNEFAGQPGTENFWIIWTASPVALLEAAKETAFTNPEGAIIDAATIGNLRLFLSRHSETKPETTKDTARQQTTVRAVGDVLVKHLELEHR